MSSIICPICNKEFKTQVYNSHQTFHKNENRFPNGLECPVCSHHSSSIKGLHRHVSLFHKNDKDNEVVYRFINEDSTQYICEVCGKPSKILSSSKGFAPYCSEECRIIYNKRRHIEAMRKIDYSKVDFAARQVKTEATSWDRYNTRMPSQSQEVKDNADKTFVERYNAHGPMGNKDVQELTKERNLENWGVEWTLSSPIVIQTRIDNLKEKEGIVNVFQRESVKESCKEAHVKSGGHENPFQFQRSIDKSKRTKFDKALARYSKFNEPLFTYENWLNNDKLLWRCKECGTEFYGIPRYGIVKHCPTCYPISKSSSFGEKEVVKYIKSIYSEEVLENTRKLINPLELDIYIPGKSLAIEFNGIFWHSERNGKDKNYHLNKTNQCNSKQVHLLHIYDQEWYFKQDIIKSIIKSNLGLYDTKIGARKCEVRNIEASVANEFYEVNHLQGERNSSINIGLFYNDELVSCISFAKPMFNKKYDWELTRFASKLNYQVQGGFGKLWKHRPEGSIITYSDKRFFKGSVYSKYMTKLKDSPPSYSYITENGLENRIAYQKHKLAKLLPKFDPELTEWENMQLNGNDRIWDCGNFVFELTI